MLALARVPAHVSPVLADEQSSPEQIKILRAMTGERRLRLAEQLYWSARKMKAAGLRAQHPDWPREQLDAELRRIFLHARS
jgi:hypothetical protein